MLKRKYKDWLEEKTDHDRKWWVARVQYWIDRYSFPTDDPDHDSTETGLVVMRLTQDVGYCAEQRKGQFDENMYAAAVLSQVLSLWYLRVHRAKCLDPNRPIKHRKKAYEQWHKYTQALSSNMTDERLDPTHFPGQDWDTPFSPNAKDGEFV